MQLTPGKKPRGVVRQGPDETERVQCGYLQKLLTDERRASQVSNREARRLGPSGQGSFRKVTADEGKPEWRLLPG